MYKLETSYEIKLERVGIDPRIGQLKSWKSKTRGLLTQQPGPVQYPIRWTTERQRRAFFARDGFGRGIPTKRTGKLAEGWVVDVDFQGLTKFREFESRFLGVLARIDPTQKIQSIQPVATIVLITIDNPANAERYVTGIQQQGFHSDTGWIFTPPIIDNSIREVDDILGD